MSSGEKTEEPTEKKLKDGRKKGSVAQSQDVNKLFVTIVGFELLIAMKDGILEKIQTMMLIALGMVDKSFYFAAPEVAGRMIYIALGISLILLAAVVLARCVAAWTQFGLLIAPEALKMDMNKLHPVNNGKNLFKMKKFVELLANIAKATVLALVFYFVIKSNLPDIVLSSFGTLENSIKISGEIFIFAARICLIIFGIISVLDFVAQKHFFIKEQKMTKDEVMREYKQSEGDPMIKGQRQQMGREMIESGPAPVQQGVDQASTVVVNPSHFAVALRYVPGDTPLPKVVCKGKDKRAHEIISYAKKRDLPIIRYVWLARTLYSETEEDTYIPTSVIKATAAVFRALSELEASGGRRDKSILEMKED